MKQIRPIVGNVLIRTQLCRTLARRTDLRYGLAVRRNYVIKQSHARIEAAHCTVHDQNARAVLKATTEVELRDSGLLH